MKGNERVWKGQATYTHTPSSWSQKSAAGEGAGRPQGGGGWTELGVAGWGCAAFSWAGLGQRVQSQAYSLQAMGFKPSFGVPCATLWSPLLIQCQCSPLPKPKSMVRHILGEVDSSKTKVESSCSIELLIRMHRLEFFIPDTDSWVFVIGWYGVLI